MFVKGVVRSTKVDQSRIIAYMPFGSEVGRGGRRGVPDEVAVGVSC